MSFATRVRLIIAGVAGVLLCLTQVTTAWAVAPVSNGDATEELQQLTSSTGSASDYFGSYVTVLGDVAVIGEPRDDDRGVDSGAAYVFTRSGDGTWVQAQKLVASDGATGDRFGVGAAISVDTIVIGAYWDDDKGTDAGAAYVFVKNDAGFWIEQDKLLAADGAAGDEFGVKVAVDGDYLAVSARGDDDPAVDCGSAYVFMRDEIAAWNQQQKLRPVPAAAGDGFGTDLALVGDTIVCGAVYDDAPALDSGSAYVFVLTTSGTWSQEDKLLADDGAAGDRFGYRVALREDIAVVGAYLDDNENGTDAGSAYVFERGASSWAQTSQLLASDGAAVDYFGAALSVEEDMIVVGASSANPIGTDSGEAYVFVASNGSWTEHTTLVPSEGFTDERFGNAVSVSGDTVIVGAVYDNSLAKDAGAAYVIQLRHVVNEDESLTVAAPGVLANDVDADGDTLTSSVVGQPAHGTVTMAADGGFVYTPVANYNGLDSFTYSAFDGTQYSVPARVLIRINPVDEPLPPPPPPPSDDITFGRRAGQDRYATSVEISKAAYPSGTATVIVATGANYPDALSGASLARAVDGPLLLVGSTVPDVVANEIKRLGAKRVYVLGSVGAVSNAVSDDLYALTGWEARPIRLGGFDRYETAALVAREVARLSPGGAIPGRTAVIATGTNFPDALAGSPMSAAQGWPILLVRPDSIPPTTADALGALGIQETIVLGSEGAVSAQVANRLPAAVRLGGLTRYDTMGQIADYMKSLSLGSKYVSLATGANFPDALTGGVLTAKRSGVMLLTPGNSLASQAASRLHERAATCTRLEVFGGEGAVSTGVAQQAMQILE